MAAAMASGELIPHILTVTAIESGQRGGRLGNDAPGGGGGIVGGRDGAADDKIIGARGQGLGWGHDPFLIAGGGAGGTYAGGH